MTKEELERARDIISGIVEVKIEYIFESIAEKFMLESGDVDLEMVNDLEKVELKLNEIAIEFLKRNL